MIEMDYKLDGTTKDGIQSLLLSIELGLNAPIVALFSAEGNIR